MYFMKVCTTLTIKPSFLSYNFTFLHKLYNIFFFVSSDLISTINSHNLYILLLLLLLNLPLKFLIIKKNNILKTFVNIFGKSSIVFSIFSFFILLTIIFNFSLFSPLEDEKRRWRRKKKRKYSFKIISTYLFINYKIIIHKKQMKTVSPN